MRTIVHIGMSKAGSTALQQSLSASDTYLNSKGVLYPKNPEGSPFINHRLLVSSILDFDDLPRHLRHRREREKDGRNRLMRMLFPPKVHAYTEDIVSAKREQFLQYCQEQISERQPNCVVLSAESFFISIPKGRRKQFRSTFLQLGSKPRFVAYLRKPSEHFLSALQQDLKASHQIKRLRAPHYRSVLSSYEECFGVKVKAHLFHRDRLRNNSIIDDFCLRYLRKFDVDPAKLTQPQRTNETLSAESMDILARYRATFHAENEKVASRDTRKLVTRLSTADRNLGAPRPVLKPKISEMIDLCRSDPLWLLDEHGIRFRDFDYRTLRKRGPRPLSDRSYQLNELVDINRDLQNRIIAHVHHEGKYKPGGDAGRWIAGLAKSGITEPA